MPGGLAAKEGLLHVGDTVLAVNGTPLKGARVVAALNAKKRPKYELTIARSTGATGGDAQKVSGELEGWAVVVAAKDGKALSAWPRKHWMVLDSTKGVLHLRESSRSAGRHAQTIDLRGGVCKAPVMMLRGKELQQPPVIQYFITRRRFPMTLMWPDREVGHDIVLSTATTVDRSAWVKALNRTLRILKEQAPTSGYLVKQGGRIRSGLSAMLSRDKRRWFVLTQPETGANPIFRYYVAPPPSASTPPRGNVVLNRNTVLAVDDASSRKHAFAITSQGANDARPVTTSLAAESHADVTRWMKALRQAIQASGGEVASLGELADQSRRDTRAKSRVSRHSVRASNLDALSHLDEDQLAGLRLKKLYELAEHMQVPTLEKERAGNNKDKEARLKRKVAELIATQRATYAMQDTVEVALRSAPLRTWGSTGIKHAAIAEEE